MAALQPVPNARRTPPELTQERLKELLHYDPEIGVLSWKVAKNSRVRVGQVAGCLDKITGYLRVRIDKADYLAHRLAWLYVYGEWPAGDIDHINRDRTDNRIANMRPATRGENCGNRNMRKDNKSGVKGVVWYKQTSKWRAMITVNRKTIHIGYFEDINAAAAAYAEAARQHFGEFAYPASENS